MYQYDSYDHAFVADRVKQYRGQVERRLAGDLTEEQFRPLRLMNGLYLQLHAYMLRVAIPYGTLSAVQMRKLADIARKYDRGYGHFTTRQNIQYNWIKLEESADILAELASVEMHAIQTSGNTIRNTTADPYAGAVAGEVDDPRVWSEIIRQWSTLHPEFSFLPRKFKIAVTGHADDRAAVKVHDIGLVIRRNDAGELGFEVLVGGGQGRTPMIAKTVREFIPAPDLLSYLEAILRTYNLVGRRDNKYKARIKIMVHELGIEEVRRLVEAEWENIRGGALVLPDSEVARIRAFFTPPALPQVELPVRAYEVARFEDQAFARWTRTNVVAHREAGYGIAVISLKPTGGVPGDATAEQMEIVADLAERYSLGEIRVTHTQNLVLPHVALENMHDLFKALDKAGLGTANIGLVSDIIACPGLDYCSLANARSIPVAQRIQNRIDNIDRQHDLGELSLKISGCINACGHHHVGNIGILGVDRRGEEYYQITIGGRADENARIGDIIGPAVPYDDVAVAVERLLDAYIAVREEGETFVDTYDRVGLTPFKEAVYVAD
jgi:sulfite reductase (NADPH) hemoprotein beta-component